MQMLKYLIHHFWYHVVGFIDLQEMLCPNGKPPASGDVFINKNVAKVLREIGTEGRDHFYTGWIAEAIVNAVSKFGGALSMEDLSVR